MLVALTVVALSLVAATITLVLLRKYGQASAVLWVAVVLAACPLDKYLGFVAACLIIALSVMGEVTLAFEAIVRPTDIDRDDRPMSALPKEQPAPPEMPLQLERPLLRLVHSA